jgi:G8 domain
MRFLILFISYALPVFGAAPIIRSVQSGPWSAATTWEGGKVPASGVSVLVRTEHTITYDVIAAEPLRSLHIAGTLTFATDRDTRLNAGLIRVQQDEEVSEQGFDCEAHAPEAGRKGGALLVGTAETPVEAQHTALIQLTLLDGMNAESCPALVDCGGRMKFHGAEMSRTWVKLGSTAKKGDATLTLAEPVRGWKAGDRVVVVSTNRQSKHPDKKTFREHAHDLTETEERIIREVNGSQLTLDAPLAFAHIVEGRYRGEVANLSRNVIVESADPAKARGHTMFHRESSGAIHYAEFRHLG